MLNVGDRVRFKPTVDRRKFGVDQDKWDANPRTGTIILDPTGPTPKDGTHFVKMDVELEVNYEQGLWLYLCGYFEIMREDELDKI